MRGCADKAGQECCTSGGSHRALAEGASAAYPRAWWSDLLQPWAAGGPVWLVGYVAVLVTGYLAERPLRCQAVTARLALFAK